MFFIRLIFYVVIKEYIWDFMLCLCDAGMAKAEKEYNANRLDKETYDKMQSDYSRLQEKRNQSQDDNQWD